jgi:flagellar hook assembly protein FlgD
LKTAIPPRSYSLSQNYPNPFNPSTIIGYYLSIDSYVNIDIFDLRGLKVKSLIGGFLSAGSHSVQWDATNDFGEIVSTGMYFYTLKTKQFSETNKMLFLN